MRIAATISSAPDRTVAATYILDVWKSHLEHHDLIYLELDHGIEDVISSLKTYTRQERQ